MKNDESGRLAAGFHPSCWLAFLLAIVAVPYASSRLASRSQARSFLPLPAPLVDAAALTPVQAKFKRLFWCLRPLRALEPDFGAGLRLLQSPELFDSVFPGYGEALGDALFWNHYFSSAFDQTVYSPVLMRLAPDLMVTTSWLGSLDLFQRYGADVLIFGHSTTYVGVPAGLLRDEMVQGGFPAIRKVLQCSHGAVYPDTLASTLTAFAESGRRVPLAIWGYGLSYTLRDRTFELQQADVLAAYRSWRAGTFGFGPRSLWPFPALSWDLLVGPSLESMRQEKVQDDFRVPEQAAASPRALAAYLAKSDVSRFAHPYRPGDCKFEVESAEVDRVLSQLLRFSDRVLVFIAPQAPLRTQRAPACLERNIEAMLRSKAGERVLVDVGDWRSYGLDYTDYVFPTAAAGLWRLDPSHTNDKGARKVTARIGRLAAQALRSRPGAVGERAR